MTHEELCKKLETNSDPFGKWSDEMKVAFFKATIIEKRGWKSIGWGPEWVSRKPEFNRVIRYQLGPLPVIEDTFAGGWDNIDDRWNYHARDGSGACRFYERKPNKKEGCWSFYQTRTTLNPLKVTIGNQPWDKSLICRPGHDPKET